jgi:hypothetical protein
MAEPLIQSGHRGASRPARVLVIFPLVRERDQPTTHGSPAAALRLTAIGGAVVAAGSDNGLPFLSPRWLSFREIAR